MFLSCTITSYYQKEVYEYSSHTSRNEDLENTKPREKKDPTFKTMKVDIPIEGWLDVRAYYPEITLKEISSTSKVLFFFE